MIVGVIGAGGVGGNYAGVLGRAGHEVRVLARGEHLRAIQANGLCLRTPEGEHVTHPIATSNVLDLRGADVVIVAVKSYSLGEVVLGVAEVARGGALVLPLMNGVDVVDRLVAGGVPGDRVLGGVTYISAARVAPGKIERTSPFQRVRLGEPGGGSSERAEAIASAFAESGVDAMAVPDIASEIWKKFVFLSALAAACGLARTPIGPVRETEAGRRLLRRLVAEADAVARSSGVALPADQIERSVVLLEQIPHTMKASLLLDLEHGGPTELDALSGAVVRLAAEAGIEAPAHEVALGALSAATA